MAPALSAPASAGARRDVAASTTSPSPATKSAPPERSLVQQLCDSIEARNRKVDAEAAAYRAEMNKQPPAVRPKPKPVPVSIISQILRGHYSGPVVAMLVGGVLVRCENVTAVKMEGDYAIHLRFGGAIHDSPQPIWSGPMDVEVPQSQVVFLAVDQGKQASEVRLAAVA